MSQLQIWEQSKMLPITKFGILQKELAVACHMDENGHPKVPVYFRDQTTAIWRCNCILW